MKNIIREWVSAHPSAGCFPYVVNSSIKSFVSLFHRNGIKYLDEKFVFIVGCGRSGNTLLRRLLMERVSIYVPPETYVLADIVESSLGYKSMSWGDRVAFCLSKLEYHPEFSTFNVDSLREFAAEARSWPENSRSIGRLVVELYRWLAARHSINALWVGDKTPLNTLNLALMNSLLPNAKYIYLERDPADVVVSYVKAGIYSSYDAAAMRWMASRRAWRNFRGSLNKCNYLEVAYEDLVGDYESKIDEIVEKFDLPVRPEEISLEKLLGDVSERAHHKSVLSPPNTSSIGKGRQELEYSDRLRLARLLQRELKDSRYLSLI